MTEIRVHGVGGASPDKILESNAYTQVTGDETAGFYRARADDGHTVEAYSWGGLNARSASRALWVLLLPFSLLNLAGWMIEPTAEDPKDPDKEKRLLHGQENSIHVVAITTTTLYVMWIALLSVNLIAYQCASLAACRQDRWWLEFLGRGFFESAPGRRIVLASLIPLGLLALFVALGSVSRNRYDVSRSDSVAPIRPSGTGEPRVTETSFWNQSDWQKRLSRLHVAQALAAYSAVMTWAAWRFAIEFDLDGRQDWGWVPVAASMIIGVWTLRILYLAVADSNIHAEGVESASRWLLRLSIAMTIVSLSLAFGLRAPDSALVGPAGDLWGFGWAPFLLLGWVAIWLAWFSVLQMRRWFSSSEERWHQLYIVALGFVIVFWRYAYIVLLLTLVLAGFTLFKDHQADSGRKKPDTSAKEGEPTEADAPERQGARTDNKDTRATWATIVVSLLLVPLRMWSAQLETPWGVDWPRLMPTLAAIVIVLGLALLLEDAPQPRWLDTTATAAILLLSVALWRLTGNLAWVWLLALVVYVALSVRWLTVLDLPYFRWNGGAAVAAFSVIVITGLMASAFLRFTDFLDRDGIVRGSDGTALGAVELKSINVLSWFTVAFTLIIAAAVIGWLIRFIGVWVTDGPKAMRAEEDRLHRDASENGLSPTEISRLSRQVARWTSLSRSIRAADIPITLISLTAALALAAGIVALMQDGKGMSAWLDQQMPEGWSPLVTISSLVGVAVVIGGYLLVRSALRSRTARQRLGIAWDVASFWPRRFHPLAPPAYAAQGVPDLADRIVEATSADGGYVVLSCHSQGTVMGLVAVASLPEENARRTALITHGSPLGSFYRPFFPRFFTEAVLKETAEHVGSTSEVDDGWINFYRDTDPIGDAVFDRPGATGPLKAHVAAGLSGDWAAGFRDIRLNDPWRTRLAPHQPPPQLLIHSAYAHDPRMADAVRAAVAAPGSSFAARDRVLLVDGNDVVVATTTRDEAHSGFGRLHRAFSVFIFDDDRRLLMQQRASIKPTFAGLWANTCCSHPRLGESTVEAATRRLSEEMGLEVTLTWVGSFEYRAEDPASGSVEHELDHVLVGTTTLDPDVDDAEADDWAWVDFSEVKERAQDGDTTLAPWLLPALERFPNLDEVALNERAEQ